MGCAPTWGMGMGAFRASQGWRGWTAAGTRSKAPRGAFCLSQKGATGRPRCLERPGACVAVSEGGGGISSLTPSERVRRADRELPGEWRAERDTPPRVRRRQSRWPGREAGMGVLGADRVRRRRRWHRGPGDVGQDHTRKGPLRLHACSAEDLDEDLRECQAQGMRYTATMLTCSTPSLSDNSGRVEKGRRRGAGGRGGICRIWRCNSFLPCTIQAHPPIACHFPFPPLYQDRPRRNLLTSGAEF